MTNKNFKIEVRMNKQEKFEIEKRAKEFGFTTLSEFIRVIAIKGILKLKWCYLIKSNYFQQKNKLYSLKRLVGVLDLRTIGGLAKWNEMYKNWKGNNICAHSEFDTVDWVIDELIEDLTYPQTNAKKSTGQSNEE